MDATGPAEPMLDHVLVEGIGLARRLVGLEFERGPRYEPEQGAPTLRMGQLQARVPSILPQWQLPV